MKNKLFTKTYFHFKWEIFILFYLKMGFQIKLKCEFSNLKKRFYKICTTNYPIFQSLNSENGFLNCLFGKHNLSNFISFVLMRF